ncbi:uncharacterized protein LOC131459952 isoform X2 [Solea solea]|nr:uncharacterized protein LOC131459952 isoform X2 [Solea solea]
MEKISMLAFHPVKMHSCYEKVVNLSLEGLQQQFDMFEQILHQSLESQDTEELCKIIQHCQDRVIKHMEKISMLAFHPVKMHSCYEKVVNLSLEGLQQQFDMLEQILHQSLESQGTEELCKIIQHCQDRVIKHMEKISMLAFHPVKMHSCYEKVVNLSLEGLQQQFDMLEQILHQSLESQGTEELCKIIQHCQDRVIKHMEKISMLAFHPVKMHSCYEKVVNLSLEGLQQQFDMLEQILHQSLESQGTEELCKIIQHCQDRVIKVTHKENRLVHQIIASHLH